ncbi:MAG: hypothetical protein HOQ45_10530, partial [Nocardioidaceae bacterium]|nr:hypothetical protein [Nocardioidaceae bacterium]
AERVVQALPQAAWNAAAGLVDDPDDPFEPVGSESAVSPADAEAIGRVLSAGEGL